MAAVCNNQIYVFINIEQNKCLKQHRIKIVINKQGHAPDYSIMSVLYDKDKHTHTTVISYS